MKVIEPSVEVTFFVPENGQTSEQVIEEVGRTCHKSEDKITEGSADIFIKKLRRLEHDAMLEFGYAKVKIIADRGLSHQLVRHRLCSFAQESTRWNNYSKGKFNSEITVVMQPGIIGEAGEVWVNAMKNIERAYMKLIELGVKAQIARSILPIGLKTEIHIGTNLREWRHIFKMRCAKAAHPIIRGVMLEILYRFYKKMPVLYEDLAEEFLYGEEIK